MNKFLGLGGIVLVASLAGGCLQTLPDGSIAAAPGTAALLMGAQDPDPSIRQSFARDKCQVIVETRLRRLPGFTLSVTAIQND
jgi:hypothetical protein